MGIEINNSKAREAVPSVDTNQLQQLESLTGLGGSIYVFAEQGAVQGTLNCGRGWITYQSEPEAGFVSQASTPDANHTPRTFRMENNVIIASSIPTSVEGLSERQDAQSGLGAITLSLGAVVVSQTAPSDNMDLHNKRDLHDGGARPYTVVIGPEGTRVCRDSLVLAV